MFDLNNLRLFALLVENKGIGRTSRKLNMAKSTISRRLAALEQQLKATLIDRNLEEFTLTDKGEEVYRLARTIAQAGKLVEDSLSQSQSHLSGDVRLSLSSVFMPIFADIADELTAVHPAIRLHVEINDSPDSQARDGHDIYVRAHKEQLADSSLRQKLLTRHPLRLVATPAFIKRKGLPFSPQALIHFDMLGFGIFPKADQLVFTSADLQRTSVSYSPKLLSSNIELLLNSVLAATGIAVLPDYSCRPYLKQGLLIEILPDWQLDHFAISLLRPPTLYEKPCIAAVSTLLEHHVKHHFSSVSKPEQGVARLLRPTAAKLSYTASSIRLNQQITPGFMPEMTVTNGENPMNPIFKTVGAAFVGAASLLAMPAFADDTPGPVVVYTNDFEDVLRDRFKTDTGRDAEIVQMSGGELLARIAAESANPQWDIIIFNGSNALQALDDKGQLKRMVEPRNLSNLNEIGQKQLPETKAWFPIGLAASCVLAYRKDMVETPPESFEDLATDKFADKVGMADPAVAAPAYPCVAQLFYAMGDEKARAMFGGYFSNGLRVFRTNGPVGRALEAGDISVALLTSQVAYTLKNKGAPIEILWPSEGAPGSVRGVGIQAKTKRPEAAQTFVEWLLEPATQQYLQDNSGADGLFEATVTGAGRRQDGPPEGAVYSVAPAAFAATQEEAIKSWFADQAVR